MHTHHPRPPLDRKAKLILGLFGLLVSFVTLELLCRVTVGAKPAKGWTDRPYAYFLPSDAHSLQDSDPTPKPPGVFRVVVVGDSFTFGPHMQLEDTFSKKLEGMLNQNRGAARLEVINRGVNGASTEQEVEITRQAMQEHPDLLILEITLNDAEPHILSDKERAELFGAPWLKWKAFSWFKLLELIAKRVHNSQTINRYIEYHSKFFREPATRSRFSTSIRRIANTARSGNVPLVAMVFPLFDFAVDQRYPFHETHEIIGQILAENDVRAVDLRAAYTRIPPERLQVIPGVDNHPNEIAHRIAAERLVAVLADSHLVPDANVPSRVFTSRTSLKSRSVPPNKVWTKAAKVVTTQVVAGEKETLSDDLSETLADEAPSSPAPSTSNPEQ